MVNCAKAVNRFVMGIDLIASKMKQEIVHEDLFISRTGVNHFTLDNGKIRSALSICENDWYGVRITPQQVGRHDQS